MSKNEVKFKTYSSFKNFREDEEKGILYIEGYASKSYHNGKPVVDLDNEFVDVTNFDLSTCTTLLFNHNQEEYAVGKCTLEQRPDGAYLRGEIHKELNSKIFYAVKHGIMTDMSIGFVATDAEYKTINGEDIFTFTNGFVYETSICNVIGANPLAKINTHKSLKTNKEALDVAKWLEEDKTSNTLRLSDSTELKSIIDDEGKCVGFNCEIKQLKEANPDSECKCKGEDIKETKILERENMEKEIKTETKESKESILETIKNDNTITLDILKMFIKNIKSNKEETKEVSTETNESKEEPKEVESNDSKTESKEEVNSKESKDETKEEEPKEDLAKTSEETPTDNTPKEAVTEPKEEVKEEKTEPKDEVKQEKEEKQDSAPKPISILDLKLEEATAEEIKEAYNKLADKLEEIETYVDADLEKA